MKSPPAANRLQAQSASLLHRRFAESFRARPKAPAARCASPAARSKLASPALGAALFAIGVAGLVSGGCANTSGDQVVSPTILALTDKLPSLYTDPTNGIAGFYQINKPVTLPMRKPTAAESKALGSSPPYPHAPFLLASDVQLEVHFTITNLDTASHSVELLVDPWNEFVRFNPGVVKGAEETTPNLSGVDRFFVVAGKSRTEGVLTTDDMQELAVDLATAMVVLSKPPDANAPVAAGALINRAMAIQNRSSQFDPVLAPYIPKVVPGLVGFDLGLRGNEPMNIEVEVVVDVVEKTANKVVGPTASDAAFTRPGTAITPPAPPKTN